MSILNFFTGIWSKVAAGFAALAGVFFFIMRYQSNKIDKLEYENAKIEKKSEIQAQAAEDKTRIADAEQEKLLSMSKSIENSGRDITKGDLNNL